MKKFLLFMLGVLVALPGIARDFTYTYEGHTLNYTVLDENAKTCKVSSNRSVSGDLIIPAVAKDGDVEYSVTSIGYNAFSDCSSLTSVTFPEFLASIGNFAFYGCSSLRSVAIPPSVTEIGENAFYGCNNLWKSAYPSGLTNPFPAGIVIQYPREGAIIEDGVVYGADKSTIYFAPLSIKEFVVPNTVSTIGENAFAYCLSMTSVIIGNSVTSVGKDAFANCNFLQKTAYPLGLVNPFSNVPNNPTNIQYPREGAIIEDGFVYGAEKNTIYFAPLSLAGEYVIPASVSAIGEKAFRYCDALTAVNAETVVPPVMYDSSFSGLYASVTLSVPDNAVGNYLATNWSLFENLKFGDSEYRTYETGNLKYCLIPAATEGDKNLAIVVKGDYSSLKEVTIPERITVSDNGENTRYYVDGIGYKAFEGCSKLATVTYNSQNASRIIGDFAFSGCKALTSIVIPGSVRTIGNRAFFNTPGLTEITLNEGLESIGEEAFYSKSSYKTIDQVYIPSTLKSVGKDAFRTIYFKRVDISDLEAWCNIDFESNHSNPANYSLYLNGEEIENLIIPESVKVVKDYAFYDVKYETLTLNEGLQHIGTYAFPTAQKEVVIPGTVTFIGEKAFNSESLNTVTFEYGVEAIEVAPDAFPYVVSLSWDRPGEGLNFKVSYLAFLTIGNSVTEIPAAGFKNASLRKLTLGNSLTTIGDEAFSNSRLDKYLTEVILPPSVESIGASAFAGNTMLTSIIMGHNVKTIGEKAFDRCPAQTVSITAQTPPAAADNSFSNYTGSLYVQGENAVKAYYNSDFCWFQFEGHVLIEPTDLQVEGDKTLTGKPGDTFQLTATLYPENVTLPQIFWRSTNPDIATVDANGLVTLHADMSEVMAMAEGDDSSAASCKIIAESLYANGPVAEITVNNSSSGIDNVVNDSTPSSGIDFSAPVEVYNLQGVRVSDSAENLAAGIYIVRQGNIVKKIAVK